MRGLSTLRRLYLASLATVERKVARVRIDTLPADRGADPAVRELAEKLAADCEDLVGDAAELGLGTHGKVRRVAQFALRIRAALESSCP